MFQNITERVEEEIFEPNKIKLILKEMLKRENILIYILTFLVSSISINSEIIPFGLAILAACMGTTVPVFMVFVVSMISTAIFHGGNGFITFFYTSVLFFLINVIFKPKVSIDERNEILLVGGKLFWSSFLYNLIQNVKDVFLMYDLFMGIVIAALTYVFYKIFVNGIAVIKDIRNKKAFSIEEVVAAVLILSIAISSLNKVTFFELNISNIIIIFIILVLGLKNGMVLGGISGVSIGLALMLIERGDLILLSVLGVSGVIAGFLNNFGKIGVILGFVLGNAILTYLVTGNTIQVIYYREILMASMFLVLVPSNFKINLEEMLNKNKLLTNYGEHRLYGYEEVKEKLNAVIDTIKKTTNNKEIKIMSNAEMKENFIQDFFDNFENYTSNIFYEDVYENEEFVGEVYNIFLEEDILTENLIINVFKKYNNYILLRDSKIKNDLQELIKIMNQTFRIIQRNNVKAELEKESNKKIEEEINNITKAVNKASEELGKDNVFDKKEKEIYILLKGKDYPINNVKIRKIKNGKIIVTLNIEYKDESIRDKSKLNNIADLLSKVLGEKLVFQRDLRKSSINIYNQIYSSEDKFIMQVGSTKIIKNNSEISGDSNMQVKLKDGKYVLAISDGMGSGEEARNASKNVIDSLNKLLIDGFDPDEILGFINSNMNLTQRNDMYASLDLNVLDLYTGKLCMIKNGACNTYVKNKKNITVYNSNNIPLGTVDKIKFEKQSIELKEDDIIVICSDGILDVKNDLPSDWVENFLKNVNTNNVQKIADLLVSEAIDNNYGVASDDITVIVAKILKSK